MKKLLAMTALLVALAAPAMAQGRLGGSYGIASGPASSYPSPSPGIPSGPASSYSTVAPSSRSEVYTFLDFDNDTGCKSRYSEAKRNDLWANRWQGRTVYAAGEIVDLPEGRISLKVRQSTFTYDVGITMRDPSSVYNLEKGNIVAVRFEVTSPGGCFLPASGRNGELVPMHAAR